MIIFLVLSLVLVILDQLMKYWVVSHLNLHSGVALIKGIVSLFYIQNTGAAWGMFEGKMLFFYAITAFAVIAVLYMMVQESKKSKFAMLAYSLILAGAIGNFVDRFRMGYVVDMFRLEFIDFPIFNVADICLTVGVGLLFFYILVLEGKEHKRGRND